MNPKYKLVKLKEEGSRNSYRRHHIKGFLINEGQDNLPTHANIITFLFYFMHTFMLRHGVRNVIMFFHLFEKEKVRAIKTIFTD